MKTVIRFSKKEEAKALPILLRKLPGMVLRDRTYIVDRGSIDALRAANVTFTELSHESTAPSYEGAGFGERV